MHIRFVFVDWIHIDLGMWRGCGIIPKRQEAVSMQHGGNLFDGQCDAGDIRGGGERADLDAAIIRTQYRVHLELAFEVV